MEYFSECSHLSFFEPFRSTSGRISSRSASVTPKISSKPGMHSSSADLHTSSGSRSSGSHILESNHTPGTRSNVDSSGATSAMRDHSGASSAMRGGVESVDVHSDSSMSGSRSLNSPRLEHGLSIDQEVIEAVNARTEGAMTDDDDEVPNTTHRHPAMTHVASETKGASSTPSPPVYAEQSSPVRYVGLYSEAVDITSDVPTNDGINSSASLVSNSNNRNGSVALLANASSSLHSSSAMENVNCVEKNSQSVCDAQGSSAVAKPASHAPRSNLNLNFTDLTRSSPSSSLSQASSSMLSSVCPAVPVSLSSPSSAAPPTPLSLSSTQPSTQQNTITTTIPATFTSTPVSASQNLGNVCYSPSTKKTLSDSATMKVRSRSSTSVTSVDNFGGGGSAAKLHHPTRQVSGAAALGQQRLEEQRQVSRAESEGATPPFPPLYSSELVEEITASSEGSIRRRMVASPSSCVTDIAETREGTEQRHYHQVRLASSSSRVSSFNNDQSTQESSVPPSPGQQETRRQEFSAASPGSRGDILAKRQHRLSDNRETVQYGGSLDGSVRSKRHSSADSSGKSRKSTSPASPGQTKLKEGRLNISNGSAVGAGAPPTRHLEAELTSKSRKLSADADLIEDIPYILHRRQDGHREETSVFKTSRQNSRGAVRQQSRSVSPGQRCSSASSTSSPGRAGSLARSQDRGEQVPRPHSVPASAPLTAAAKERSRRLEFINVHKLPSRLSYSSKDDTTSPSGEQGILKSLDLMEKKESTRPESTQQSQSSGKETGHKPDASESQTDQSVSTSQAATAPAGAESPSTHNSESDSSALSPGVQFYSPKLPGSQRLTLAVGTSVSDESPDHCEGLPKVRTSVSSAASLENVSDLVLEESKTNAVHPEHDPHSLLQYFEVSKPQPHHVQEKESYRGRPGSKNVPKSLPIESLQVNPSDLRLASVERPRMLSTGEASLASSQPPTENKCDVEAQPASVPQCGSSLSVGRRVSNGSETNQFLIDLPSPAAALFYSENSCESPPATKKEADESTAGLTFSTFRPDDAEEDAHLKAEAAARNRLKSPVRWALQQSARDGYEATDYKVIMTEGVVEKSALKKKKSCDDRDKAREPKRVSWHEDGDLEHSYHSDLGMNAEDADDDSSCPTSTGISSLVNSADIMETLENLRNQHSESDLTNSGSSVSSSATASDEEADNKEGSQVPQGEHSNADGGKTLDSEVDGVAGKDLGVVQSAAGQGKVGSGVTSLGRRSSRGSDHSSAQDNSPLEPLERLCLSLAADTFDDEGEADDEDDEPNFPPPPPPIVNLPEEMLQSYESDLPLPDLNSGMAASGMHDPPGCLAEEGQPQAPAGPSVGVYSSDSDTDHKTRSARGDSSSGLARFIPRQVNPRLSLDPLAQLEFGDLVADMHCTTSESESDFDAEEANSSIRRVSTTLASSLEKSLQHGLPLYSENPSHRAQLQQHHHHSHRTPESGSQDVAHVVHKTQPVSASGVQPQREAQPPKCYPKPARTKPKPPVPLPAHATSQQQPGTQAPPPVFPRPGHLRQPQMGKGIQRHKTSPTSTSSVTSSSSSSSSSTAGVLEVRRHPPPPPPAPPQS